MTSSASRAVGPALEHGVEPDPSFPLASAVIAEITREFPAFRIVPKEHSWHQRMISGLLKTATFGRQRHYMTVYHTVMGYTLFVPTSWPQLDDTGRAVLLRHERVHLRQRRRYGMIPFAALYLIPFFPVGLAYGRARLEWEAYAETLRATAELCGLRAARSPELHEHIVQRFVGPDYLWMWPFRHTVRRWIEAVMSDLEGGAVASGGAED